MKRYESYKDSGIEWVGEIPSHWEVKRVNELSGLGKILVRKNDLNGVQVYHYSIPSVQQYGCALIEDGSSIDSDKFKIFGNEILFSKLNPRKGTVIVSSTHDKLAVASTEFVVLMPFSCNINYMYYCLINNDFKTFLSSHVESATKSHQRVNPADIYKAKIPIPFNIEEQTAIASYLDRRTAEIDALIADKKRLLELYEEERTAIINQAVTKGLDPNAPMKDSGVDWLGEIPEGWEVRRLKYVVESVIGGGTPSTAIPGFWNGNIPWVSAKDVKVRYIYDSEDHITDVAIESSATNLITESRVIMALYHI